MAVSLTWIIVFLDIPIVCMIEINILQKLLESHLPCGHSPSMPRLKHPLLCYIFPRAIHLSLLGISRTRRIYETSLSLIVEESLTLALPKASLRHVSPRYIIIWGSWLITWLSCHNSSLFPGFPTLTVALCPFRIDLLSHMYHMYTITMRYYHHFIKIFKSVTHRFLISYFHFHTCSAKNQIHKYEISFSCRFGYFIINRK